ncbi:MAG TPA: DUF1015 domain-containing protein [Desulfobacterales bacterium]|nr:DUF1015 domain-containing protein [Desulfobacterales bacterium]
MARIAPLRGLRYNPDRIANMEEVVSPPYDVIDQQSQQALARKNPYNMIHLDLTKSLAAEDLTDERYQRVRETFENWQRENILIRDSRPGLYLYFTEYTLPSGRQMVRKGFISLVGLAELSEGVIKPHEKTFKSVTSDRLRLIDTCQAQFSPIFSLYSDPEGQAMTSLEAHKNGEPLVDVCDHDGCRHLLWQVTDADTIAKVQALLAHKAFYIADGHHRYNTSLQLRELMRRRQGEVGADSPYDYTMMYLCGMEDEGLSVLPTHRLVHIPYLIDLEAITARMADYFIVEEISGGTRELLLEQVLSRMDENDSATIFGFYHPGSDRCFLLTLRPGVMEKTCSGKHPEALRDLDVTVLSELVLECILNLDHEQCERDNLISYYPDPDEALDAAVKGCTAEAHDTPLLFLMNSTLVAQVRRVADESLVMPHKSTYFYPKLLSGLLINQIHADEKIVSAP